MLNEYINQIQGLDTSVMDSTRERMDRLLKPLGSLGRLEEISILISGITGSVYNKLSKKCIIIMAADNGICEEGISSSPQAFTAIHTVNFTKGLACINVLSSFVANDIRIVDIGINADMPHQGIINKKIRKGTGNFAKEISMSQEEVVSAIKTGIEMVGDLVKEGYQIIGTGEMGIGNTTSSSAVLMAFTQIGSDLAVGKGAGLSEEAFKHKKSVIEKALAFHTPDSKDPIDVLSKVGGLDIAGLCGCFLGAAIYKIPIVIDGFISAVAALCAVKLDARAAKFMLPSHASAEPGYKLVMQELGLSPILNLDMRVGEGTGCPLAFQIIDAALDITRNMSTFEDASVVNDFLIDIRES